MTRFLRFLAAIALLVSYAPAFASEPLPPESVVYGVLPTLFDSEHPLRGVTLRLDHLKELGVTVLLLSPIFPSDDPSHISYAVTDYRRIREDFGTIHDLEELVSGAHTRGLKVLMDFVPNHTSSAHPWFIRSEKSGADALERDFYTRDESGEATHYFDWENLPNLNLENQAVRAEIIGAMRFWLEELNVDGFRIDAAWGPRQRYPETWAEMIRDIRAVHPSAVLIAEASTRDSYYVENGFQAAYDWSEQLGEWAWQTGFENPKQTGPLLLHSVLKEPHPEKTLRFLNNNDTGKRFVTRYGAHVTKVAAIAQFTMPGIPFLYTGDETGAAYEPYADPPPLKWDEPNSEAREMKDFYSRLIALRMRSPELLSPYIHRLEITGSPAACAYLRSEDKDPARGRWCLVVLNFGSTARLTVRLPASIGAEGYCDILSGRHMTGTRQGSLTFDQNMESASVWVRD